MKITDVLKPFMNQLKDFMNSKEGLEHEPDDDWNNGMFFFMFGDTYIPVEIDKSYWYEEDDGTIVYRINEIDI